MKPRNKHVSVLKYSTCELKLLLIPHVEIKDLC